MRHLTLCVFALVAFPSVSFSANFLTESLYSGQLYADKVYGARGLYADDAGDVLVVAASVGQVLALWSTRNSSGAETVNRATILNAPALTLNHGITYSKGYLYVSSQSTVYRYPYTPGQRTLITDAATVVVSGMPNNGGHSTRTLVIDKNDFLYVSVGSHENIDPDSTRAKIRRFPVNNAAGFPLNFVNGEVYADGTRNEVGLALDKTGRLWGVENSGDDLKRPDLGGDIHNGNPAEELNRFGEEGKFYGYPFCFSSYFLPGYQSGSQFAWPDFLTDGVHDDNWCQDRSNNIPPALVMPAHQAPLGIEFLSSATCDTGVPGSFPCSMEGDAFVAFHGSWNSDTPVGYRVARIPFNKTTLLPTGEILNIIYEPNTSGCGNSCFRPVNAVFNKDGHLIVSADASNEIFRVVYNPVYNTAPATQQATLLIFMFLIIFFYQAIPN